MISILLLALLAFFLLASLIAASMAFAGAGYLGHRVLSAWQSSASTPPVIDDEPDNPMSSLTSRVMLPRELGWLVIPFVVAGSFGAMTDRHTLMSEWGMASPVAEQRSPDTPLQAANAEAGPLTISTFSTSNTPTRPTWVDQPSVIDGDCQRLVLTSSQYSTRDEAEQELRAATVKLLEEDLKRIQSGPFRPKHWRPEAGTVVNQAVTQRHDDVTDRDFGSFTHPMHRVSWQVELSPRVRTEFIPAWRHALISHRILLLAAVASLFAMAASASVLYFRLDLLAQGRSRGWLKPIPICATAAWFAAVATMFSQGHLW